jgi:hypothetical protein
MLEDVPRTGSVWVYVNENKEDTDPEWLKPFAAKEAAEDWIEAHRNQGRIWKYPLTE